MSWRLVHHFVDSPCRPRSRSTLSRDGQNGRRSDARCPHDNETGVGRSLAEAITGYLAEHGIDYDPSVGGNSWLWCLGGPGLYRGDPPAGVDADDPHLCIDLHLNVCDTHEAISVDLFPYDLVPESGGSSADDPRQCDPIPVGSATSAVDVVLTRLDPWLNEIVVLPR